MKYDKWMEGFHYGWDAAMKAVRGEAFYHPEHPSSTPSRHDVPGVFAQPKPKRKSRRQSGKQKLLTDMAGKKWKAYKRNTPKGKKTYIDIRAQVSRSQAYKKKARRLK